MLQVYPIPAFEDNYFWLIQPDSQNTAAYIVDPGAAEPVKEALNHYGLELHGILITHHHHDHIDGASELSELFEVPIYGPSSPRIPQITHIVAEGDELKLHSLTAKILTIPGHTLDHIAYYFEPANSPPLLFSGDTIFAAGCGRLFDGTAPLLFNSLQRIAALPDTTMIYAAHEYTLSNIRFALSIEPDNNELIDRKSREEQKRQLGLPTLPTSLLIEKRTNPFLRCHLNRLHAYTEGIEQKTLSDGEVFASLRRAKDKF